MSIGLIETLESRTLLSADSGAGLVTSGPVPAAAAPAATTAAPAASTGHKTAKRGKLAGDPATTALSPADVQTILAQAISQARPTQAVVVTDREGTVLGVAGGSGLDPTHSDDQLLSFTGEVVMRATERARTAAAFESSGEAFTTRTARYIIQNNFPQPIRNTGGGPLYGVEFSDLPGSDIILPEHQGPLSGDPGGIPLYIRGVPVGAIGVAGDEHDTAPVLNFKTAFSIGPYGKVANPNGVVFNGNEDSDFDESVALAGTTGYAAPERIRATNIFVAGLRFPFIDSPRAHGQPTQSFNELTAAGKLQLFSTPSAGLATATVRAGEPERVNAVVAGVPGLFRITDNAGFVDPTTGLPDLNNPHTDPQDSDPVIDSNDMDPNNPSQPLPGRLTKADVMQVITDAVHQATITRAGIRKPNGVNAVVHVAVVDRTGDVLGVFRMEDGTNFSYDIAVQKARTAAYFSDDQHALTPTALGFMSQRFFPTGIEHGVRGPLFQFQDVLSFGPNFQQLLVPNTAGQNLVASQAGATASVTIDPTTGVPVGPRLDTPGLRNGITIFPGAVPLYRNGILIGAVGVSGDGVNQDDIISFNGGKRFQPPPAIRVDNLDGGAVANYVLGKLNTLEQTVDSQGGNLSIGQQTLTDYASRTISVLNGVQLPYVKFPRNPRV